jgi:hypothetical protein
MSTTTSLTIDPVGAPAPAPVRWHRPLLGLSALMALLVVVSAVGMLVDDRTVNGSLVWFKPFKFAVSFALYGVTLAWFLQISRRAPRTAWWTGAAVAVLSVAEMVAVVLQVVRGKASHFNNETPFDDAVFSFMGNTVVLLWTATLVLGVIVSLQRQTDPATTWAIRFGLAISLAGMLLGFLMVTPTPAQRAVLDADGSPAAIGAHSVGVPDGGPSMPITGWATTGGDLRVPHFVGIHALQVLPLLALVLLVLGRRSPGGGLAAPKVRLRLLWIAAFGYAGTVGLLAWQALRGQALLHPDVVTLGAVGALVLGVGAATAAVLR